MSLNDINPEANQQYSKALFAFLKDKLGVEDTRGYITFSDPGRDYLGYIPTTVAAISK